MPSFPNLFSKFPPIPFSRQNCEPQGIFPLPQNSSHMLLLYWGIWCAKKKKKRKKVSLPCFSCAEYRFPLLERYRQQQNPSKERNWNLTKHYFRRALLLSPNNGLGSLNLSQWTFFLMASFLGKSYHQMALVSMYENRDLDGLYYFARRSLIEQLPKQGQGEWLKPYTKQQLGGEKPILRGKAKPCWCLWKESKKLAEIRREPETGKKGSNPLSDGPFPSLFQAICCISWLPLHQDWVCLRHWKLKQLNECRTISWKNKAWQIRAIS